MKKRRLVTALCFACATLMSTSSWTATTALAAPAKGALVAPVKGVVLINRGKGFSEIKKPVKLRVGNAVMVGPESAAIIAYGDGCKVDVAPGTVETVAQLSPCASGASAQAGPGSDYSQSCGPNGINCVFWPVFGAGVGFIAYEIYSAASP
jgi:hypothetical protein